MCKVCAFTIVAKNYIGLGLILGQTLKKHNPNIDFKIIVADEFETKPSMLPAEVLFAKEILQWETEKWTRMTFQYDLTQFCTSIKPASILYLLNKGYDKVLYFDPDIFVFSPISEILEELDQAKVVLTPQVCRIHVDYKGEHPEWAMNCNGIFNLGFGGFKNDSYVKILLEWWDRRLDTECFSDRTVGNFTDQKWMDWVPGFLNTGDFSVLRSLGLNMAPWNFFERRIYDQDGTLYVTDREDDQLENCHDRLVFIHFAGYDYSALKKGIIKRKRIESLKEYEDLLLATSIYRDAIANNADIFDLFINQKYSYGAYENGDTIEPFHRRMYHGLIMNGKKGFNPFSTGSGSFHAELIRKHLIDSSGKNNNISRHSYGDVSSKRKIIETLMSIIKNVGGYKRYIPFTKSLIDYCRPEFHTFLINPNRIVK